MDSNANISRIVVANLNIGTSAAKAGAKCYITLMSGDTNRVKIRLTSRGGRKITTWIATKNLTNIRLAADPIGFLEGYHGRSSQEVCEILKANNSL